jgi:hypothetical protein
MWNDIETTKDFLNFTVITKTVTEFIAESCCKPNYYYFLAYIKN